MEMADGLGEGLEAYGSDGGYNVGQDVVPEHGWRG